MTKYKYTRKQAIELIRRDWNFEIMKNVLLAKEHGECKQCHNKTRGCHFDGCTELDTPPIKEDIKEIKPLDVPSNYLKTWPTNEIMIYHKLCEIIDVINHLSSVEK